MKKLQLVVIAVFLCYSANTFAQKQYKIIEQEKLYNHNSISYAKLETGNKQAKDKSTVIDFLLALSSANNNTNYKFLQQNKDNDDYITQHYQQYYKSIKVVGATYAVHIKGEDIDFVNGNFATLDNFNLIPKLEVKDVIVKAKFEADKQYKNISSTYYS
ncbi:MAG: hypothetical protein U0U67_15165 [Chitinophagales bacterium]